MKNFLVKLKYYTLVILSVITIITAIFVLRNKLIIQKVDILNNIKIEFTGKLFIPNKLAKFQIQNKLIPFVNTVDNLTSLDLEKIYNDLKKITWIENLAVIRNYEKELKILIKPYDIIACKEEINKITGDIQNYPITKTGKLLKENVFCHLIKISNADDINEKDINNLNEIMIPSVPQFFKTLSFYKDLLKYVSGIEITNELCFNLKFFDGSNLLTVKLPENYKLGLDKLLMMQMSSAILSKDIEILDLRVTDKYLVKLRK